MRNVSGTQAVGTQAVGMPRPRRRRLAKRVWAVREACTYGFLFSVPFRRLSMRGIDFREARAQVRIAAVLDLIGFVPRQVLGAQARGPCPLHRSRNASSRVFAVHLSKN